MYNPPHPGEILKELYIDPLGLTVTEVATGLKVTRKTLSAVLNKRAGISPEMAIRLSIAFNTTPMSWLSLQQAYNLWQVKDSINSSTISMFNEGVCVT